MSAAATQRNSTVTKGLDPSSVAWDSEQFHDQSMKQLKRLAHLMMASSPDATGTDRTAEIARLATSDFQASALKPENLQVMHDDRHAIVRVWRPMPEIGRPSKHHELFDAVSPLVALDPKHSSDVSLKNTSVLLEDKVAETRVIAEGSRPKRGNKGRLQWSAMWRCRWALVGDALPRLASIELLSYEEVESSRGRWLQDLTDVVFRGEPSYREQLAFGMEYWVNRIENRLRCSRLGHNGIAIGDVTGDGREDIYVCQSGGLPNRLYVHQSDGSVVDIAANAEVDFLDDTTCALIIDVDNDGDQDLVLATVIGGLILENNGEAGFQTRVHLPECANVFSLTAADYDQDGLLDLYVGRYWPDSETRGDIPIPVPYFDANNGGENILFRNLGQWQFADVTRAVGLDENNTRFTMAASWNDLDDDGDVDLYVANDYGRNCFYRNEGGSFVDIASTSGTEDIASGMSVTFSDYDHDGRSDIYVSNMYSTAGNRTTFQRQYRDKFQADSLSKLQRLARGNTLFHAKQPDAVRGAVYEDVSLEANVTMGRWAWGSLFVDLNNDSWDDLLVANGFLSTEDDGDL